jgi:hypothetical protein
MDRIFQTISTRRRLVLGGLAAGLLQVACRNAEHPVSRASKPDAGFPSSTASGPASSHAAQVPPLRLNLASYGGEPGASPSALRAAFGRAFAILKEKGGGSLLVPAGVYDFGSFSDGEYILLARGLRNVAILAHGATFKATTNGRAMPHMFYFVDFDNVTLAGAGFTDGGFAPWVEWKGMYGAGIQAERASRGFRMVDCRAERVVGLFAAHNNESTRHLLSDISIQGEVRHAYYGIGASYIAERVKADLVCHNVRRAFIAYGLKNADIRVRVSSTGSWPGSNGLVSLVAVGGKAGNVENVRLRVDASGAGIYGAYVHFYHQGPDEAGYMRDIDATVNAERLSLQPNLFRFSHEIDGVQKKTPRVWDRIHLRGRVRGEFGGRVVDSLSQSTAPGKVYVTRELAAHQGFSALPANFHPA